VSHVEAKEIGKAIDQLKGEIAELEIRLQNGPIRGHPGSLRSIGIRVLISAERIENMLSDLTAKEKSK
jgi:hypothetical protein